MPSDGRRPPVATVSAVERLAATARWAPTSTTGWMRAESRGSTTRAATSVRPAGRHGSTRRSATRRRRASASHSHRRTGPSRRSGVDAVTGELGARRLDEQRAPRLPVDRPATVLEREILQRGDGAVVRVGGDDLGPDRRRWVGRPSRVAAEREPDVVATGPQERRRTRARGRRRGAPRGHSSAPTTTLMPAPMAMSCTRTRPVRQPCGHEDVEQHDDEHGERRLARRRSSPRRACRRRGTPRAAAATQSDRVVAPDGHQHRGRRRRSRAARRPAPAARSRRCRARWNAAPTAPRAPPRTRARPRSSWPRAPRAPARGRRAPRCGSAPTAGCSGRAARAAATARARPAPSSRVDATTSCAGERRRRRRSPPPTSESRRSGNAAPKRVDDASGAVGRRARAAAQRSSAARVARRARRRAC